eukprot:Sspe_Gene.89214::Locus_61037_Transcript_1_1_Confidence_1.000_Length_539::g.89214::m.89214
MKEGTHVTPSPFVLEAGDVVPLVIGSSVATRGQDSGVTLIDLPPSASAPNAAIENFQIKEGEGAVDLVVGDGRTHLSGSLDPVPMDEETGQWECALIYDNEKNEFRLEVIGKRCVMKDPSSTTDLPAEAPSADAPTPNADDDEYVIES